MNTYEFINPSDRIEFDATCDEVAALAALVVGQGLCSAQRVHGGPKATPDKELVVGFAFVLGDGGFAERYGRSVEDAIKALASDVVASCHSFRLVNGTRSSLSNWCGYAHAIQLNLPEHTVENSTEGAP